MRIGERSTHHKEFYHLLIRSKTVFHLKVREEMGEKSWSGMIPGGPRRVICCVINVANQQPSRLSCEVSHQPPTLLLTHYRN